ncbi:TauD/TfdA dioxygenase family protein [Piscinibacter koreensis]|uniref:TauD/TfdA family dioxygenase n=1 Tax=Piscinibacter koreensis TaxID=2742824 RepID=A0A7Y6NRA0_9BURK|nr:TauD/TfdA family dioxygenase [Schlegelella koreensis]NUZ07875.1 TauD/TfdA family dioxygenase [Schlegelella koreensis]
MNALLIEEERLAQAQPKILKLADDSAERRTLRGIDLEPYAPAVGATVRGLRLQDGEALDPALHRFIYEGLLRYGFLAFEPGTVTADAFGHLVGLFGEARLLTTPYTPAAGGSGGKVNTIDSRHKKTRMNFIWHIDQAFRHDPPRYTALFGKKVPPFGGDTLFANATAAYDLLDPLLARYLETLTAVHDIETQGFLTLAYQDPHELELQRAKQPPIEVPLIRVHPETGRKQIFVNELYTQRIIGLSRTASESLIALLLDLVASPDVQARFRWEEGAALIWDNRTVQHRGVGDYGNGHRLLHRAVVQ